MRLPSMERLSSGNVKIVVQCVTYPAPESRRVLYSKTLIMNSFFVCLLLLSVVYGSEVSLKDTTKDGSTQVNVTETERANKETVSINVQRVQVDRDQNGGFEDARILKVCTSTYFSS